MKKVKLSLAALALVVAIAGTAAANANKKEADPCSKVDPKRQVCISDFGEECCEDEGGITWYYPPIQ